MAVPSTPLPPISTPVTEARHAHYEEPRNSVASRVETVALRTGCAGGDDHGGHTADDGPTGSSGKRIRPIDTRIRLQLMQTQGFSMRSKANFGNTHMIASQPGPVNLSIAKLVEEGSSFTEARQQIGRATREAHQRFTRQGEEELAKEMSFRSLQERVKNAHTTGPATLTHKIERMHKRTREREARRMLAWNEVNKHRPKVVDNKAIARELMEARRQKLTMPSTKTTPIASEVEPQWVKGQEGSAEGIAPCSEGEKDEGLAVAGETELEEPGRKSSRMRDANSVAFVLRKLYTGGGLDAQQEGWEKLPSELFNTLTMQLGTISKINMPRNSLDLLISLRNPNFSCAHMRSVAEINVSGNKLAELPTEAQRLTSLRTLRLDNNKLSGLPDGLLDLTSLTSLSVRHNNFSNLPYRFGDLRFLQKLDLGENMLKTLPPTMGLLTSLKHLKLDGNNMPHLAIPPPLKTSDGKDPSVNWAKRWHREMKKEVWTNQLTGETSDGDPKSIDRSSNTSSSVMSSFSVGTVAYNRRRNALASRGVLEWEAALNVSTGRVYYVNNVNLGTAFAMPLCMDRLGEMTSLVTLKLSQNKLRTLPSSVCACENMEILEVNDNYLERLPLKLGDMKRLKSLRLDINCLRELPPSMVNLSRLEELSLTSNFFAAFPEFAMKMFNLKKLLLGNNQLKKLPYAVGFLSSLETLQLYNNPLADPPAELLLLGMDKMLWECRQRHWAKVRGLPPTVRVHGFGIEEEKLELLPEFERKLATRIKTAGKTGELNFMMEGLTYFPMRIFDEEVGRNLTGLRLDSNDFSKAAIVFRHTWQDLDKTTHSVSLCNLLVLSLKSCKLSSLGDDIAELGSLRELYLESNRILHLPDAFTRLRTLEILDMKKNRLQDCPDGIGTLARLKRLELDGNRLELLPDSLSELGQLEVLTLSSNHVYRLPKDIVRLHKLRIIDATGNMLTHLPPKFGRLKLRSLKLSYNRLETLRHDVFLPALKGTLRQLWLSNNNLLQLPDSLTEVKKPDEVQLDSNPFKSPPCALLAEGLSVVMLYLKIRIKRIAEMHDLILNRGFDTALEFLVPEACGVLRSDTGYLAPADLDEFDKAVDRYINGDYYRHPLSADAILDMALELKATREREFFQRMVAHLMARIMFHETSNYFSENVFCRHATRPWGRSKGPVGCFMIASSAVFDDTSPNAFVEEFRSAMWSEAINTLPKSVFEYSVEAFRKALKTLKSAYGPIARFEKITFDYCECVDVKTGEELRHPRGECVVPGLVIVKIIYTAEEAERRSAEDAEVIEVFAKSRKQVQDWLKTKQGRAAVTDEVKKRKAAKRFRVAIIEAKIIELKGIAILKKELLAFAQQRKTQYEDGEPFHFHSLATAEEAIALVVAAQKEVADCESEALELGLERAQLKQELKEKMHDLMAKAEENILDKYCYVEYAEVFKRNRTAALKRGWRRPWDGMDGEEFAAWARNIKCVAAERRERPQNVAEYRMIPEVLNLRDWDEAPSDLTARLNWNGTENMEQFLIPRLTQWKAKHVLGAIDDLLHSAEGEGDEESKEDDTDGRSTVSDGSGSDTTSEAERDEEDRDGAVALKDQGNAAGGDGDNESSSSDGDRSTKRRRGK